MTAADVTDPAKPMVVYAQAGSGQGLVLLHGHPFDHTLWAPQIKSLSEEFHVLAPDLPGYGASAPRGMKVTMRQFADSVLDAMDEVGMECAIIAGMSMGGLVAMELALASPQRVDGLVIVGTSVWPVTPAEAAERLAAADRIERDGILDLALEMAAKLLGPRARRDPRVVEPVVSMMLRTSPAGAAAGLRGRAERPDYRGSLAELKIPALAVSGTHDPYLTEQDVATLAACLSADVLRLDDVGHIPNLEAPAEFNRALSSFAGRILVEPGVSCYLPDSGSHPPRT